jgi:HK97 family phage portal protein
LKKEHRSLFQMIFGGRQNGPGNSASQLKMLSGYTPVFSQFGSEAYNSDEVRAAVDAFARNAAKLHPKRLRRDSAGNVTYIPDGLDYLLSVEPNPFMDAYTFYYKIATQYLMQNNAFVYIRRDSAGNITMFWPLNGATTEWLEYQGQVYARFMFMSGERVEVPYADLVHLRRFFYKDDMFGETNMSALSPTLELVSASNQGIINAIKSSAFIRGILKFTQNLKDTDRAKRRDEFVNAYLDATNNNGVGVVDGACDYQPVNSQPQTANAAQMKLISDKINKYFGISDAIIKNDYTSAQWNAFYSSMLEPFALQMGLQFTAKCFTGREIGFGNQILFEANRLQYASNDEKVQVATLLTNIGAASLDQILDMFALPTIGGEEGSRRVQTLNMVKAGKGADQYQGIDNKSDTGGNTDDGKTE